MKKTVLVVDDDRDVVAYLSDTLKRSDFRVITASGGIEAVELARNQKPDCILLDVVMPNMPGDDVADILSKDPSTADIPVIFLTALISRSEKALTRKTGKHYVISKPAAIREIVETIKKIL